jgi:hypothetical protein
LNSAFYGALDERADRAARNDLFPRPLPFGQISREFVSKAEQITKLSLRLRQMLLCHCNDFTAGRHAAVAHPQDGVDLMERKAEPLGLPHKLQPPHIGFAVNAVPGFLSRRRRQQAFALVKSDCLNRHSGTFCQFANLHVSNLNPILRYGVNTRNELLHRLFNPFAKQPPVHRVGGCEANHHGNLDHEPEDRRPRLRVEEDLVRSPRSFKKRTNSRVVVKRLR